MKPEGWRDVYAQHKDKDQKAEKAVRCKVQGNDTSKEQEHGIKKKNETGKEEKRDSEKETE